MLDDGRHASISEMAAAEQIERGYLGRLLRLTLLAPDIVEAILDGRQPADLALPALLKPFPADWVRQRGQVFGPPVRRSCGAATARSGPRSKPGPCAAASRRPPDAGRRTGHERPARSAG